MSEDQALRVMMTAHRRLIADAPDRAFAKSEASRRGIGVT
jgi:hypothetical protein